MGIDVGQTTNKPHIYLAFQTFILYFLLADDEPKTCSKFSVSDDKPDDLKEIASTDSAENDSVSLFIYFIPMCYRCVLYIGHVQGKLKFIKIKLDFFINDYCGIKW